MARHNTRNRQNCCSAHSPFKSTVHKGPGPRWLPKLRAAGAAPPLPPLNVLPATRDSGAPEDECPPRPPGPTTANQNKSMPNGWGGRKAPATLVSPTTSTPTNGGTPGNPGPAGPHDLGARRAFPKGGGGGARARNQSGYIAPAVSGPPCRGRRGGPKVSTKWQIPEVRRAL